MHKIDERSCEDDILKYSSNQIRCPTLILIQVLAVFAMNFSKSCLSSQRVLKTEVCFDAVCCEDVRRSCLLFVVDASVASDEIVPRGYLGCQESLI